MGPVLGRRQPSVRALAVFGLIVAGMLSLAFALIVPQVAQVIASERDRKTLDALLASRFSSAEIVLGAIGTGLFRFAHAVLAGLPVVALVVFLGGVPTGLVILAASGLASTAFLMAAFGVVASVGSRTAVKAVNLATSILVLWGAVPTLFVMLRPIIWPGAPTWLTSAVLALVDGSPMGLVINLGGIIPRPGGPIEAVARMVAWELLGGLAMVVWAIVRLRPASRGLYDVEGEATRIKKLRAAMRRPPRRPPCYDDPVLWYEIHSTLGQSAFWRGIGRAFSLVMLAGLAWLTWWFAKPAFDELLERGYRASREAFKMPEMEPFARLLVGKMFPNLAFGAATGQARLEFNVVLREFTGIFVLGSTFMAFQCAFESVKKEQKRDTWLGLIATPLTAWEILRGKMLGSLWKTLGTISTLIALWTIGLMTGAVHPLGFLAGVVFLVVSAAFFAAQGLSMALASSNPEKPPKFSALTIFQLPLIVAAGIVLTAGPMLLGWVSLFSYEDVHAMIHGGPFPQFHERSLKNVLGARSVVVLWLIATAALAVGAVWQTRANVRGFDKAIGRPTRPEPPIAARNPAEATLETVASA